MKLLPFPEPRLHLRRRATSKGSPEKYRDHSTRILSWMDRNALRRITEVRKSAGRYPTLDELESWISDHCVKAKHYVKDFDGMVTKSAIWSLEEYDEAEYAVRVKRASNGGKVSGWKKGARGKRPPKFTVEQLQQHEHLSIKDQAIELKCSEATISRIRRRQKAEIAAEHEQELDALFGPQEAAQPLSEDEEDEILASLDADRIVRSIPKTSETSEEADAGRTTTMTVEIPDHVPADWVHNVHVLIEQDRREAEARATFDIFDGIEVD